MAQRSLVIIIPCIFLNSCLFLGAFQTPLPKPEACVFNLKDAKENAGDRVAIYGKYELQQVAKGQQGWHAIIRLKDGTPLGLREEPFPDENKKFAGKRIRVEGRLWLTGKSTIGVKETRLPGPFIGSPRRLAAKWGWFCRLRH